MKIEVEEIMSILDEVSNKHGSRYYIVLNPNEDRTNEFEINKKICLYSDFNISGYLKMNYSEYMTKLTEYNGIFSSVNIRTLFKNKDDVKRVIEEFIEPRLLMRKLYDNKM